MSSQTKNGKSKKEKLRVLQLQFHDSTEARFYKNHERHGIVKKIMVSKKETHWFCPMCAKRCIMQGE